jgi:hypothetical protein
MWEEIRIRMSWPCLTESGPPLSFDQGVLEPTFPSSREKKYCIWKGFLEFLYPMVDPSQDPGYQVLIESSGQP